MLWASPCPCLWRGALAERQDGMGRSCAVVERDGFREVDRGEWVGQTLEEIGSEEMARWNRDPTFRPGAARRHWRTWRRACWRRRTSSWRGPWGPVPGEPHVGHALIVGEAIGFDTVKNTARLQVGREVGRVGRKVGRKVGRFTRGGRR